MTLNEQLITIIVAILAVQLCRWLAFWVFPVNKPIPPFVQYLGQVLPPAIFGLLVIYCYKHVDLLTSPYGSAEFLAGAIVIILHLWTRNMFISIGLGTVSYMYFVQYIFVT